MDPWTDDPASLLILKDRIGAGSAVAISKDQTIPAPEGVQLIRGDPLNILSQYNEEFDLVVINPPFDTPVRSVDLISEDSKTIRIEDEERNLVMLRSALLLSPEGVLFAIVHPDFFQEKNAAITLIRLGLFCEAALTLPRGIFSQVTGRQQLLIIIRKGYSDMMMAGELSSDSSRHEILLRNLRGQKSGKTPELGVFIRTSTFRSLGEILLEEKVKKLAHEHGVPPVPFSGITRSIIVGACGTLQDAGGRIYLPFSPDKPPQISSEDLLIPPSEVACILLRSGTVDPGYLLSFFDTELGRAIRELVAKRAGRIEHFSDILAEATIYLPPPQIQAEVIRIDTSIKSLKGVLTSIQRELWAHPLSTRSAVEQLEQLKDQDDFADWAEALPFPLASILRAYIAENIPSKKVSHLFHFFEASAEFIAVILLSAIAPLAEKEEIDLLDDNPEFRDVYSNATFRSWIILCRRSARQIRKRLSSASEQEGMAGLFGNPTRDFIDLVTSKRLFALFDEVADLRNDWKGHGGIVGERGYEQRLTILEAHLSRCREIMREHFEDVTLIRPGAGEYRDGIFSYQVHSLTGTHPRFVVIKIRSLIPLDTETLYLYPRQSGEPLRLLPFFRLILHPETGEPAWYFYNRIVGRSVRWISYHYESESEFDEDDEEVYAVMRLLGLISEGGL
ncbi:hypothetical protein [Methanocalculus sp.]|uniref:hypothetical protein n=2 Tax=Methanocalculus sp. TaxID=2004547 RepID=UPI002729D8CF|nr:hypothetical protein [Methanocalculus sp.]